MSRIGKQPIEIPDGVTASFSAGVLSVKGPKGELKKNIDEKVVVEVKDKQIIVNPKNKDSTSGPLWGTVSSHISNMVVGVTNGYEKKLEIQGVGYKGEVKGSELIMNLGFSHQVKMPIPSELKVVIEKGFITVSGINKDEVGSFSAHIRDKKKPEPYKGKGVRYFGEVVTIKQGKKSV